MTAVGDKHKAAEAVLRSMNWSVGGFRVAVQSYFRGIYRNLPKDARDSLRLHFKETDGFASLFRFRPDAYRIGFRRVGGHRFPTHTLEVVEVVDSHRATDLKESEYFWLWDEFASNRWFSFVSYTTANGVEFQSFCGNEKLAAAELTRATIDAVEVSLPRRRRAA